jgi:serine O-acetyltransferase
MSHIITTLNPIALSQLLSKQLNNFFPDGDSVNSDELLTTLNRALERLEHCFSAVQNKYFFDGERVYFDHLHGDQYAMWLYLVSNQLHLDNAPVGLCKKVYLLNKALHGCDIYFEVELPSIFLLVHPLGTVLGRGKYQDYFAAYQRCGVGSNHDIYPRIGRFVTLRPGSSILGDSHIGDKVTLATESLVLDSNVEADSVYFGNPREHWTRKNSISKEVIWRT